MNYLKIIGRIPVALWEVLLMFLPKKNRTDMFDVRVTDKIHSHILHDNDVLLYMLKH